MNATIQTGLTLLTAFALKVLGAIVLWFVGRWLIRFALKLMGRALERQSFDRTLVAYIQSAAGLLWSPDGLLRCPAGWRGPRNRRRLERPAGEFRSRVIPAGFAAVQGA